MKNSLQLLVLIIFLFSLGCGSPSPEDKNEKSRTVENNIIKSDVDPKVTIEIDSSLKYIGRFDFSIKADTSYEKQFWNKVIAAGERIVFANVKRDSAEGIFIAQFEGFLPDNEMIYRYNFNGALEFDGGRFRNNSFVYDDLEFARERPGNEAHLTRQFLEKKGIAMPKDLFMTRFVTVTDSSRKKEMILFYVEDAEKWGVDAIKYDSESIPKEKLDSMKMQLRDKAIARFKIDFP